MNHRERTLAVLNYEDYDRLPIVHFGYWEELLAQWRDEGHISPAEHEAYKGDGSEGDRIISQRLGFDCNWSTLHHANMRLSPSFAYETIETLPDGFRKVRNYDGVTLLVCDGADGIPAEVDHLLKGRKEWEEHYLPRLQYKSERINREALERLKDRDYDNMLGLWCGSLIGVIRDFAGVVGLSYLTVDDEPLLDEMIETVAELCYRCTEEILDSGVRFDFGHFWEDICYRSGPLVNPKLFASKVGPHYRRITDLLHRHGINIVSVDCDGKIDELIPTWLSNGVNTMFPIEVGTWHASIAPWRERYGRELRGVGGMNKLVFARDRAAIDAEIERLKPLVELGGFIPCPDHRIPLGSTWDNVRYYCDRMREVFS